MLQFIICTHGIAPDQRLLDALFYQEARHWGNLRPFSFLSPDRQRQLPYPVVAGTGAATCLCCTRLFLRRRGRAVAIGATASRFPAGNFPCCASPAGGRQHGAGGPCCSTGPANFVGSSGAAGQIPLPLTAYVWGVSCHAAGRFHRGGGLSFSLCSRSPWRAGESR